MRMWCVLILIMVATTVFAQVQALAEWKDGTLLAMEDRLLQIDPSGNVKPAMFEGVSGNVVATTTGNNGDLWIATDSALMRCKQSICKSAGTRIPAIQSLAVDAQNALWIGTRSGLLTLKDSVATPSSLASNMVEAVTFSADGAMWFASGFEVFRVKNGKSQTFSLPPPPANVRMRPPVTSIEVTKSGKVFVGTHGGLLVLEGDRFVKKSEDEILALLEDSRGTLWVGTSEGLKKIVKSRWIDVALPER